MTFKSIPDSSLKVGRPVTKELVNTIRDNFEDLNDRVNGLETVSASIVLFNDLVKKEKDHHPVGTYLWSALSEEKFNDELQDGTWQLADGGNVSGTDYAAVTGGVTLADVRGRYLRAKSHASGNDPAGDLSLGTFQQYTDMDHRHVISHTHQWMVAAYEHAGSGDGSITRDAFYIRKASNPATEIFTPSGSHAFITITGEDEPSGGYRSYRWEDVGGFGGVRGRHYSQSHVTWPNDNFYTSGVLDAPNGSGATAKSGLMTDKSYNDLRPSSIIANCFVKTQRNYIKASEGVMMWRAPQNLTVNQVILTPVKQGTAGDLVVDIKKGDLGSITTSIFDEEPTLAYDDTEPVSGTLNATNAHVMAGEYIRVDFTQVQSKLEEFHLLISASPA